VPRAPDAAKHSALFYDACVRSIGRIAFRFDDWGVDLDITGSQTGLMLPAGLGIVCASKKALAAMKDGNLRHAYFDLGDQIKANENKSVGLYLSIPIFNRWQVQTGISSAKVQVQMAELNLQNTQNNLNKTIQQAHADAVAALNRYKASEKSVTAYEEAFKYTQQKYDVGLLNSIDYNDAKNKLAKSRSDLLQAKYEYVFRLKVLDFYQGKPLNMN